MTTIVVKEASNATVLEPGKYGIFGFKFERYDFDLIDITYSLMSSCKGVSDRLNPVEALVRYYFIQCRLLDWKSSPKWSEISDSAVRRWCKAVMEMYLHRDFSGDLECVSKNLNESETQIELMLKFARCSDDDLDHCPDLRERHG